MFENVEVADDGARQLKSSLLQFSATTLKIKAAIFEKDVPAQVCRQDDAPDHDLLVAIPTKLGVAA